MSYKKGTFVGLRCQGWGGQKLYSPDTREAELRPAIDFWKAPERLRCLNLTDFSTAPMMNF